MVYEISWLIENRVIHVAISGDITVEALNIMSDAVVQFIDRSNEPYVHLVIDDKHVKHVPNQILNMLNSTRSLRHPRLGWLIIYGKDNKLFRFLTQILSRMTKLRHRRFLTLEESVAFLQTVDETLPELNTTQS